MSSSKIEPKTYKASAPLNILEERYSLCHFQLPNYYANFLESILVPHGLILDRIEKMAHDIFMKYQGQELHIICILKGSRAFCSHLFSFLEKLNTLTAVDRGPAYFEHYVKIKTYNNMESTGEIEVLMENLSELKDKHIIIVEDIIDTGFTLSSLCSYLNENVMPESISIAALLDKRTARSQALEAEFVGFTIPDVFVVGFSMDYNERFRDLRHLGILNEKALATLKKK